MPLIPVRKEALTRALISFIGRQSDAVWDDQFRPLRAAEAYQFFELLDRVTNFIEGKVEFLHFRGKPIGAGPRRPILEIRPVTGLEYVYVVISDVSPYICLAETQELGVDVAEAIEGPLQLLNDLPVNIRKLEMQPVLVHDERSPHIAWYQTAMYVYLAVSPGAGLLADRLTIYDSWGSPTGRPEWIDVGGIPSPATLASYTDLIRKFQVAQADAPTQPG